MNGKILAIVNPHSSNGKTGKQWPQYERIVKDSGIKLDSVYTKHPLHATELTRNAIKSGYYIIISVGGDGTMNEVLNGFYENDEIINDKACLAVFSKGTGCDFVRTLGIDKTVEGLITIIKNGRSISCDIVKCNFVKYNRKKTVRYFLNVSDVGIGGETTYRVNKNSKALKGFLSFLFGAVSTIITYKNKNLKILIDNKIEINERLNSIIIANGRYFGGGMLVAPDAKINDGLLDIIILGDFSKIELMLNLPKIYKGKHTSHPKVRRYLAKNIKIKSLEKALIELDGEQPGTTDARYCIIPNGIKIMI